MRVILTATNQPADYETGYALRLIEQGRAIPAPKQTAEDEAEVEAILAQRTKPGREGITPLNPSCEGGQETAAPLGADNPPFIPPEGGTFGAPSSEGGRGVLRGAQSDADLPPEPASKPHKKSSKKAGDSNVAG